MSLRTKLDIRRFSIRVLSAKIAQLEAQNAALEREKEEYRVWAEANNAEKHALADSLLAEMKKKKCECDGPDAQILEMEC